MVAESDFWDYFDGTRKVEVGPPGRGYFVELFENAAYAAMEGAVRAMAQVQIGGNGQPGMRGDLPRYQVLSLLAHISEWNLPEPGGTAEMPVSEANVRRLPLVVFNRLWQEVEKLDAPPTKEERKRFRDQDGGGDPARDEGPEQLPEVPAGAGGALEAWAELGGVPAEARP